MKCHRINLGLRRRVDRLQLGAAKAVDLPFVAGAEKVIAVRRAGLRENEGISERGHFLQRRPGTKLAARGDGKAFDVAGKEVFGVANPPELRRNSEEGGSCEQRDCERDESAH